MSFSIKEDAPEPDEKSLMETHRRSEKIRHLIEKDRVYVRFSVRSDEHTSSKLMKMFGIEPQDLMDDGDVIFENNRYLIQNTGGYWVLNSLDEVQSKLVEDHLKWLLNLLYDKRDLILKLQSEGAITRVKIHAELQSGVVDCRIDSRTVKRFAQLNLGSEFAVSCRKAL